MINSIRLATTVFTLAFAAPTLSLAVTVLSFNATGVPDSVPGPNDENGWRFKASTNLTVNEILTKFGAAPSGGATPVTLELWENVPSAFADIAASGANLLLQQSFTPTPSTFTGVSFQNLTLTEGSYYFIGFRNVRGWGGNYAASNPSPVDDDLELHFGNYQAPYNDKPGAYPRVPPGIFGSSRPILEFHFNTEAGSVPEPGALGLMAAGLATLIGLSRRRT